MEIPWSHIPDLTLLIRRLHGGDKSVESHFFAVAYGHLQRLAALQLNRETRRGEGSSQDLLHDVYLNRLANWKGPVTNRNHYAALVCLALRDELCDRARKRGAIKRTPPAPEERQRGVNAACLSVEEILALEREIERLGKVDPRAASVVRLRYYGGCSWEETALATGATVKAVRNDWEATAAWLAKRLGRHLF